MPDDNSANDLLIAALQEHGLRFERDLIANELNDVSKAQWVMEHVNPHTLLSRDEVVLVKSLERSGVLDTFLRHPELTSTRAFSEDDIRTATATLKSSTAKCTKQITALKSQLELIEKLQHGRGEIDRDHDRYMAGLNRQHLLEKQRIKAMAEDITSDFESRMLEYQQQTHAVKKQLLQNVSSKLMEDDNVLLKTERVVAELESTETDGQMEKRALDLIATLSKLTSEEIRCRLDRLYLETILTDVQIPGNVTSETVPALEEDLESLYSEIEVLAEMSARQEFGRPILGELQKKKQNLAHSLEDNLDMILDVLSKMTHSTKQQIHRIQYHQSHRETLDRLSVLFKEEITTHEVEQVQNKKSHRRESSRSSLSPAKNLPPQPQISNNIQSSQALESFLRRLGIFSSSSSSLTQKDQVIEKRSEMADLLHHSLNVSAEVPLLESLGSSDEARELLSSILQADSHAAPSLVNQGQSRRLTELEKELTSIQKGIEGVEVSVLVEPDRIRDKFIEKWKQP